MEWLLAKPRSFSNLPAFLDFNGRFFVENWKKNFPDFQTWKNENVTNKEKASEALDGQKWSLFNYIPKTRANNCQKTSNPVFQK